MATGMRSYEAASLSDVTSLNTCLKPFAVQKEFSDTLKIRLGFHEKCLISSSFKHS